ncbi:hypothetical protein RIF29_15155 [Crotalaria pallida]|uniref:Uncharacterized protein n=1 Tax=Crotalaria pallida TaxID=3830 RepID=A0AAN9FLB2_CROPI
MGGPADYHGGYPMPLPARIDPKAEELEELDAVMNELSDDAFEAMEESEPEEDPEEFMEEEYPDAEEIEVDPTTPSAPSSVSSFSCCHAATPPFSSSTTARLRSLSIHFSSLHVHLLQASTSVTFVIYLRIRRSPSTLTSVHQWELSYLPIHGMVERGKRNWKR